MLNSIHPDSGILLILLQPSHTHGIICCLQFVTNKYASKKLVPVSSNSIVDKNGHRSSSLYQNIVGGNAFSLSHDFKYTWSLYNSPSFALSAHSRISIM